MFLEEEARFRLGRVKWGAAGEERGCGEGAEEGEGGTEVRESKGGCDHVETEVERREAKLTMRR